MVLSFAPEYPSLPSLLSNLKNAVKGGIAKGLQRSCIDLFIVISRKEELNDCLVYISYHALT